MISPLVLNLSRYPVLPSRQAFATGAHAVKQPFGAVFDNGAGTEAALATKTRDLFPRVRAFVFSVTSLKCAQLLQSWGAIARIGKTKNLVGRRESNPRLAYAPLAKPLLSAEVRPPHPRTLEKKRGCHKAKSVHQTCKTSK